MRAVVRHRVGEQATDALGDIIALDEDSVTVRTRKRGDVQIAWRSVVVAKPVPPRPSRRGRPHRAIGIDDLQQLMVAGMPPLASARIGRWLLRAADGYTGRGNSMLPLGDPGMPLEDAVASVERWYAERDLPALVQYFGPSGFDPDDEDLGEVLRRRGWRIDRDMRVLVLTADAATVGQSALAGRDGPQPRITISSRPTDAWWSCAAERALAHRATAERIFDSVETGRYLTATASDRPVGAARLAVDSGWAGVFEIQVRPDVRRSGLGRALLAAAAREAADLGAGMLYLQVAADNVPAIELYRSVGFDTHHEYYYARTH